MPGLNSSLIEVFCGLRSTTCHATTPVHPACALSARIVCSYRAMAALRAL
jgi:hypothetical protein